MYVQVSCYSVLSGSGVKDLLLEDAGLGEAKSDLVGGKLVVAVGDGGDLVLHEVLVEWVEEDLLVLSAVNGDLDSSSGNVGWEADVIEDLLVDGREASRPWSHLGWVVLG